MPIWRLPRSPSAVRPEVPADGKIRDPDRKLPKRDLPVPRITRPLPTISMRPVIIPAISENGTWVPPAMRCRKEERGDISTGWGPMRWKPHPRRMTHWSMTMTINRCIFRDIAWMRWRMRRSVLWIEIRKNRFSCFCLFWNRIFKTPMTAFRRRMSIKILRPATFRRIWAPWAVPAGSIWAAIMGW